MSANPLSDLEDAVMDLWRQVSIATLIAISSHPERGDMLEQAVGHAQELADMLRDRFREVWAEHAGT